MSKTLENILAQLKNLTVEKNAAVFTMGVFVWFGLCVGLGWVGLFRLSPCGSVPNCGPKEA